jgi:hypothetical protein
MMHKMEQSGNQMTAQKASPPGNAEAEAFLSELAINGPVAASTKGRGMAACARPWPLQNCVGEETGYGRVAELADAKDLGSFGAILAGSTPVAPTLRIFPLAGRG